MNHPDLNDLQFYAMVVEHGGFAAAERALGVPKSRLSRRIAQLESDLGVRLLQRSTRKFAVTDVGQSVYRHAQTMLAEAQAAREAVDRVSAAPRGVIKVSCPVALAQELLAPLLPEFMKKHPQVRIQLHVSNRRVDVIQEGFDVALRVRSQLTDDGEMVARSFGQLRELLVASPKYLDRTGRPATPADLAGHTTLSMSEDDSRQRWTLHGPDGHVQKVDLTPALMAQDFPLLLAAARDGLGVVLLPELSCAEAIRKGELEVVLPEWNLPQGICHAIYPSRRGLLPAVRVFIDFLADRLPALIQDSKLKCGTPGGPGCPPSP
ncbi:LysR family transcriptional regulator [bacterium BD-1]|uniref:LysR family transcriptional regulator n=1 Tax=Arenimonas sp. TaxID=1872635 RepID=UPI001E388E23|nr:LysR family transcriptional regulator [Ottowia caeni]